MNFGLRTVIAIAITAACVGHANSQDLNFGGLRGLDVEDKIQVPTDPVIIPPSGTTRNRECEAFWRLDSDTRKTILDFCGRDRSSHTYCSCGGS